MKKLKITKNVTRAFGKAKLQLKKHSPEILVISGVVGTVAAGVMACKATTKASDILEEMHESMDQIHKVNEMAEENENISYDENDLKKDTAMVYVQTGVKFAKLYGPSLAVGILSITSILVGHNILRKRNLALAAAYTTVSNSFKAYRGRVVDRFGKDLDRELRYDVKAKEVEETVVDENGNETTVKNTVNVIDPNQVSDFARIFDDGNIGWEKDAEHNLAFLKMQQNYANHILQTRGYLFLNEVYEMLGFNKSKAGQVVGWYYDEKNPTGDNFVDFGIYRDESPAVRAFVNGDERSILLDFNVDGEILNRVYE